MVRRELRYTKRVARLDVLAELDGRSRRSMAAIHSDGLAPEQIRLRSTLVRAPQAAAGAPTPLSPMTWLIRSRGIAQQLLLAALFEAQCRVKPGRNVGVNARPLSPRSGVHSWVDIMAAATAVTEESVVTGSKASDRMLRQVRRALSLLSGAALALVVLDYPAGSRGRYEHFYLRHERARARPYSVPRPAEAGVLSLDVHFFTNGWVHVLEETEVAFLLMIADLHVRTGSPWVFVSERDRSRLYGLGADAYQAHHVLAECGLIQVEVPEGRREDGTFEDYSDYGAPPHRFKIREDGFRVPALPRLIQALKLVSQSAVKPASSLRREDRFSPAGYRKYWARRGGPERGKSPSDYSTGKSGQRGTLNLE